MWLNSIGSVVFLVLCFLCLSWILHLSFLTIVDADVYGADPDITDQIHTVVMNELNGSYFKLVPRDNSFFYPKRDIASVIKADFPRVLNVDIGRDDLKHLRVTVNEKTPVAVVCATLPNFVGNQLTYDPSDPCYLSDSAGFLFEKAPVFTGHPYHIYYAPGITPVASLANVGTDVSPATSPTSDYVGSFATSTPEFVELQSFYDGIEHAGIEGDGILIKDDGEYELYSSSTIIYFNDSENIPDELANLTAFWGQMKKAVFDYIDVRYDNNVFYKEIK